MTEIELLSEIVELLRDLLPLVRVSLVFLGCLCGVLSAWMVCYFIKNRDLL